MNKSFGVEGKTIAVIGAAGRIGHEIVRSSLNAGANIMAFDANLDAINQLKSMYGKQEKLLCGTIDITNIQSVEAMLEIGEERFGNIDGAVNTAYPRNANYGRKFFDVTYEDFCQNLSTHLGGYFLFMQQCAKFSMEREKKFSLINMSSIYGVMAPRFDVYEGTNMTMPVEYAAIKSGLVHLTKYANAYTRRKFRANCISPGGILASQNPDFLEKYSAHCMSKGMLDSHDVIGTVIFLLSDASEYIIGQNIIIDDGFSL